MTAQEKQNFRDDLRKLTSEQLDLFLKFLQCLINDDKERILEFLTLVQG